MTLYLSASFFNALTADVTFASFFFEACDEALADDCDDAFLLSAFELDEAFFDDADETFDSLFFELCDEVLADDCDELEACEALPFTACDNKLYTSWSRLGLE